MKEELSSFQITKKIREFTAGTSTIQEIIDEKPLTEMKKKKKTIDKYINSHEEKKYY